MKNFIPAARVAALIEPWIERHSLQALSWRSGISDRAIARLLKNKTCRFETADALLCASVGPEVWHLELADLYYANGNGEVANGDDVCDDERSPDEAAGVLSEVQAAGRAASSGWSGADGRTVSMATAARKISAPKGGRFGFHQVVGGTTLCGIDASAWKHVEGGEEVTCAWCSIRLEHGVTQPTPMAKLPDEAREAIDKEVARQKRAAKRKATA